VAVTVNIYNDDQLKIVSDILDANFIRYSNGTYNYYAYGLNCKHLCIVYKLYLAKRILADWTQNQNGDVGTNYNSITDEQFTNILVDALNYCN
jgi:hypothetical protein